MPQLRKALFQKKDKFYTVLSKLCTLEEKIETAWMRILMLYHVFF